MWLFKKFLTQKPIDQGVKLLTYATNIRWFGWGIAESILPVFLFSFTQNYASASLLRSIYDIIFIISLPVAGLLADRLKSSTMVIFALLLYILIGFNYFIAGATGLVIFIVIARFLNGISYSFDLMGRETYTRRVTKPKQIATVLGYVDTVANFGWIIASLIGIFLIKFLPIHYLLLFIIPTSLIALIIILYFRKNEKPITSKTKKEINKNYLNIFSEFKNWNWNLRLLSVFNFFTAFCSVSIGFFLPIESYLENGSLSKAMLIGIFLAIPTVFGTMLGKYFDKKGLKIFPISLLLLGTLILLLGFSDLYLIKLIVALGVGIILELLSLGSSELITVCSQPEHYGRIGGMMAGINDFGYLIGPIIIGVLIDWQGIHIPYLIIGGFVILLSIIFYFFKKQVIKILANKEKN